MNALALALQERDEARAEVANLRAALADITTRDWAPPDEPGHFTLSEQKILERLFDSFGAVVRRTSLWNALYALREEHNMPEPKLMDVFISKIRRKLVNHKITAAWGVGYKIERIR